jgi:hypothetical protein
MNGGRGCQHDTHMACGHRWLRRVRGRWGVADDDLAAAAQRCCCCCGAAACIGCCEVLLLLLLFLLFLLLLGRCWVRGGVLAAE